MKDDICVIRTLIFTLRVHVWGQARGRLKDFCHWNHCPQLLSEEGDPGPSLLCPRPSSRPPQLRGLLLLSFPICKMGVAKKDLRQCRHRDFMKEQDCQRAWHIMMCVVKMFPKFISVYRCFWTGIIGLWGGLWRAGVHLILKKTRPSWFSQKACGSRGRTVAASWGRRGLR